MIESISISNIATYSEAPESLEGLSKINFLFGSNGTGKTTISRVIADEEKFPKCTVKWKGGTKLQALVYNSEFVDRNFKQSAELKGVFTLGKEQVDALEKITAAKTELDRLKEKIETLRHSLQGSAGNGGKKRELAALEDEFKAQCWAQKQKHDGILRFGFEGFRNNAERFKEKVLQENASNKATLLTLAELEKKSNSVFGTNAIMEKAVPAVETSKLLALEMNPVLKKRVIGRQDIDITAMISKLENSDWVREGAGFYNLNNGACPFCQQPTSKAFAQSLSEYFDETFMSDSKAIDDLATNYATEADLIQQQIVSIIESPSRFLDLEELKSEKELLDARIALNNQRLIGKKKEVSLVVDLEPLSNLFVAIKTLIDKANSQVDEHNKMVANIAAERTTLTAQMWKFVLNELKTELDAFNMRKAELVKAIVAMDDQIEIAKRDCSNKSDEIRDFERQITSIQPTIDDINGVLAAYGFQGFKLAPAATGSSYVLLRSDSTDAMPTLSEGEKTFVTFLYFYHLLKGSHSESGVTNDRIVVIDDPVSSLDSNILFIVSSLIKGMFDEVRLGTGHIKQIFVLTHNVYFHKEVTYNSKRKNVAMKDETFWIVRKIGLVSKIERHASNPVKTSYELLWAEVRKKEQSNLAIQNTLRRILENYFKILGGINLDDLCALFEGEEKLICKSLISWLHDGSHYAHDDLFVSIDESGIDSYLKVFREIFEKSSHGAHYEMMMGDAFVEAVVPEPSLVSG